MFTRLFALTGLFASLLVFPVLAEEVQGPNPEEVFDRAEAVYATGHVCRSQISANSLQADIQSTKGCRFLNNDRALFVGTVARDDGVVMYHLATRPEVNLQWEFGGMKFAFSVGFPVDYFGREDLLRLTKVRPTDPSFLNGT